MTKKSPAAEKMSRQEIAAIETELNWLDALERIQIILAEDGIAILSAGPFEPRLLASTEFPNAYRKRLGEFIARMIEDSHKRLEAMGVDP